MAESEEKDFFDATRGYEQRWSKSVHTFVQYETREGLYRQTHDLSRTSISVECRPSPCEDSRSLEMLGLHYNRPCEQNLVCWLTLKFMQEGLNSCSLAQLGRVLVCLWPAIFGRDSMVE